MVSIDAFAADIVNDYGRYTSACAIPETAERLAVRNACPGARPALVTIGALRAVPTATRARELVLDAYLLRARHRRLGAGADRMRPLLGPPAPAFHIAAGGSVCVHCRPTPSATPPAGCAGSDGRPCTTVTGRTPRRLRRRNRSQASGLVAAHLQWHLERRLRTLPPVERGPPVAVGLD